MHYVSDGVDVMQKLARASQSGGHWAESDWNLVYLHLDFSVFPLVAGDGFEHFVQKHGLCIWFLCLKLMTQCMRVVALYS